MLILSTLFDGVKSTAHGLDKIGILLFDGVNSVGLVQNILDSTFRISKMVHPNFPVLGPEGKIFEAKPKKIGDGGAVFENLIRS